jgi:hypothetical protein
MRYLKFNLVEIFEGQDLHYAELAGDSTETKPTTGIVDGSQVLETDTGDVYVFNEKSAAWIKMFSLKG